MTRTKKAHRDPVHADAIPSTTIKLGWGDKRQSQAKGAGLYVYYGERFIYQSFDTLCVTKHFLNLLINGDDYRWGMWPKDKIGNIRGITPEPMLITDSGIMIRGAGLEAAMEYEFESQAEREFVFPEPYAMQYATFAARGPVDHEPPAPTPVETRYDPDTGEVVKLRAGKPIVKEPKTPKSVKEAKPKVDKSGLVLVADIAADLKADPKHVRAALRKAKVEKPAIGWAFPKADVARITKLIKDNLK